MGSTTGTTTGPAALTCSSGATGSGSPDSSWWRDWLRRDRPRRAAGAAHGEAAGGGAAGTTAAVGPSGVGDADEVTGEARRGAGRLDHRLRAKEQSEEQRGGDSCR